MEKINKCGREKSSETVLSCRFEIGQLFKKNLCFSMELLIKTNILDVRN